MTAADNQQRQTAVADDVLRLRRQLAYALDAASLLARDLEQNPPDPAATSALEKRVTAVVESAEFLRGEVTALLIVCAGNALVAAAEVLKGGDGGPET
jgi:hypothetical protein